MGLATARAFAEPGAAVTLVDVNASAVASAAEELTHAGHQALGLVCDVTDEEQVADVVARTVADFGRLDMAFNNAGIQIRYAGIAEEEAEDLGRVNAVNNRGVWAATKHELRQMRGQGSGASLKHFAANNQETERMTINAEIDPRTLREIYLPAFERAVKNAQPWTVMCSCNKINGVYASEDPWLLTDLLRSEWGFEGLVSDWGAVNVRPHAVAAGMDLEMPSSGGIGTSAILEAVRAGELAEADVDRAATRVLELVCKALPALEAVGSFDPAAHHQSAREAAQASAVLLKNDGPICRCGPTAARSR